MRYFVATLICILTSWWVAMLQFQYRDEKGGWGKPNQTYANQPKSLKGSKVNETFHFLFTSLDLQFYLSIQSWSWKKLKRQALSKCFKGKNEMGWNLEPCKGCLSFKSPIIFTKTW